MKKMLWEMKISSLISMLHIIIGWGAGGFFVLFFMLEHINIRNMTDETMVIFLRVVAILALLIAVSILVRTLAGSAQKEAKKFISKLNLSEQEKLVLDYQNAWHGSRTIRVGQKYTYVCGSGTQIFSNYDIVWLYAYRKTVIRGFFNDTRYYLLLYLIDKEEPEILETTKKTYSKILEYYEHNFPHIIVGDSDEVRYLYRNDRNQFLHLRYYNEQNKAE